MNGTLISITVGGTEISLQTEASVSLSAEMVDITTKEDDGWKKQLPRMRSGSLSFSVLHDEGEDYNMQEMWTAYTSNTAVSAIKFTTGTTGDYEFSASGWFTSLEMSSGVEDNVTVSGTIEFDGAVTYTVIA